MDRERRLIGLPRRGLGVTMIRLWRGLRHHSCPIRMHAATFLQDLAVVMIVAGLVTVLFRQLRQPVVLGYIIAGVLIGPHTPPFPLVRDEATIHTLADHRLPIERKAEA